jgi:uncharacterized protein with NRDE domain
MCLLALCSRVVDDAPLVVGANREEAYARGGEPPQVLDGPIHAVGGRDPVAGGAWLAVNARGVLIAVTNRPKLEPPASPRSRGLLVRDLLGCPTAAAAVDQAARALGTNAYAGCNLVCADADRLVVIHAGDWLRVRHLPPGIHVLTGRDVDDASDPRLAHALGWLADRHCASSDDCAAALQQLCGQVGEPPMCLRGEDHGTVSSSVVVLRQPLTASRFLHAQGPPDRAGYLDYSHLFRSAELQIAN